MIKRLLLCSIALFILACQSDSEPELQKNNDGIPTDPPPAEEVMLLPKTIHFSGNNPITYTLEYEVNTAKLKQIISDHGSTDSFIYQEKLIGKITYEENRGNSLFKGHTQYTYQDKVLNENVVYRDNNPFEKTTYTFLPNSILQIQNYGYENQSWKSKSEAIQLQYDAKGNLQSGTGSIEDESDATSNTIQINLKYNDTHSPLLSIEGLSKINYLSGVFMGDKPMWSEPFGRRNNVTELHIKTGDDLIKLTYTYEYTDTRNTKFPTKITLKKNQQPYFTITLTYH